MLEIPPLQQPYRGYVIEGDADVVSHYYGDWCAIGRVFLHKSETVMSSIDRLKDPLLTCANQAEARIVGLWLAELLVDYFLPPAEFYLRPMDFAFAVALLAWGTEKCTTKEIRKWKLYEALDYLEKALVENWPARQYRRLLIGDRRNDEEREELRRALEVTMRTLRKKCAETIIGRMNGLATRFKENRQQINRLRRQLLAVR